MMTETNEKKKINGCGIAATIAIVVIGIPAAAGIVGAIIYVLVSFGNFLRDFN